MASLVGIEKFAMNFDNRQIRFCIPLALKQNSFRGLLEQVIAHAHIS